MTRSMSAFLAALLGALLGGCGDVQVLALAPPAPLEPSPTCAPAAASGEAARPADDWADFVGVGLRLGYSDTPYADRAQVSSALLELGVRHVAEISADAAARICGVER